MGNVLDKVKDVHVADNRYISSDSKITTGIFVAGGVVIACKLTGYLYESLSLYNKRKKSHFEAKQQLLNLQNSLKEVENDKVAAISKLRTEELLQAIKDGEYSCEEVLKVFQCKALEAHQKTNCLVQPVLEAQQLVKSLKEKDKEKLLYGLPVSLKENFGLQDYDSTIGSAHGIGHPYPDDAVLVKVLKYQGAIPFVRTNVPQTMLSWETTNPIYGTTTHPLDPKRGVGGSSGGEGALIAAGGSLLGLGGDIGGSIRIPASACGIAGLKPTSHRLSQVGTHPFGKGQLACTSSFGPMAADVDTLVLAMRAMCVPKMWELDPNVPPVPFNDEIYNDKRPLKIGYYLTDQYMEPAPAMKRGVLHAKSLLEKMGHTVVEWDIPAKLFEDLMAIWPQLIFADQGKEICDLVRNDALDSSFRQLKLVLTMPIILKKILAVLSYPVAPKISMMLSTLCGSGSVYDYWQKIRLQKQLREQFLEEWKLHGFDAVIAPGFVCPAATLGTAQNCAGGSCYTCVYNVLDFAAGSLPVTTVSAQDEQDAKNYPASDMWHRALKRSMPGSTGLPVNVQVVTLPWQEELCLRVMKQLETAVEEAARPQH